MLNNIEPVLLLGLFAILPILFVALIYFIVKPNRRINYDHVNEDSYQKYAKFYGNTIPGDADFNYKINIICDLVKKGEYDIKKIAEKSNCTLEECVLKIRYLKNKRIIGDYYVDTNNFKLLPCSSEDQKLIEKYKPFVYGSHLQVDEIANVISNKNYKSIYDLRDEVYNELVYLNDKGLINGIKIDDVDRKIIYYTIEKRKVVEGYESVHCPSCGALNDVEINGKVRCSYCKTIIKSNSFDENVL